MVREWATSQAVPHWLRLRQSLIGCVSGSPSDLRSTRENTRKSRLPNSHRLSRNWASSQRSLCKLEADALGTFLFRQSPISACSLEWQAEEKLVSLAGLRNIPCILSSSFFPKPFHSTLYLLQLPHTPLSQERNNTSSMIVVSDSPLVRGRRPATVSCLVSTGSPNYNTHLFLPRPP